VDSLEKRLLTRLNLITLEYCEIGDSLGI